METVRKNMKLCGVVSLLLCLVLLFTGDAFAREQVAESPEEITVIEIEYGGKIISVDMADMILVEDQNGNRSIELSNPEKYAGAYANARFYGLVEQYQEKEKGNGEEDDRRGQIGASTFLDSDADADYRDPPMIIGNPNQSGGASAQEISRREYDEEQTARSWTNVVEDLALRDIDRKALELVREFGAAKDAVPPMTGSAGTVVITYSSYTPRIVCRPMYVTDVMLQPGETVTGVHPGDPVRWQFVPSHSGAGDAVQTHVLIKPLMADISTNLVVNTDRRTYQFELVASSTNHMPSVSFAYPDDSLKEWESFLLKRREQERSAIATGYSVNPEDLHLDYEIRGSDALRWKPVRVWDDGVKTYIQFKPGSTKKSVEAPVFIVYEHKKQVIANYRATEDMYVVDRLFDKAALIVGTGAHQDRVVITRLKRRGE